MLYVCTFRDGDPWFKVDSTGHNKIGYLTTDKLVVYPVRRHFVIMPAEELEKKVRGKHLTVLQYRWPEDKVRNVDEHFTQNILNPHLMFRGMKELSAGNYAYFNRPIRLPKLQPIEHDEHTRRWSQLMECIQPGDTVQVLDQKSLLSRLIARVDQGTWSHTAGYIGGGMVQEAITSGVVEREMSVYKTSNYRIGIYRSPDFDPQPADIERLILYGRSHLGAKYSWKLATRLGLKKLLRTRTSPIDGEISPNDLVSLFNLELIYVV